MADTTQPDTTAAADLRHWWRPLLARMELGALNELRIRADKPHLRHDRSLQSSHQSRLPPPRRPAARRLPALWRWRRGRGQPGHRVS